MGWRRFLRRGWWDDERARELQSYIDIETDENIARGMSAGAARQAALRRLGNTTRIREEIYAMNTVSIVDTLWQDLQYAARLFGRTPGFTAVAVFTLALGIGGVTVIYSVIRNVLLDPFPYTDSSRMVDVIIRDTASDRIRGALRIPEFLDYQEQSDVFEDVIGTVSTQGMTMPTREGAQLLAVARVTPNTFAFLGVPPLVGRGIIESDGGFGAPPIVVLSHKAWIAHFGGSPDAVGRTISLDETARTVVGVMPPRFTWHVADAWIPDALHRTDPDAQIPAFWFQARLKHGVTIEQAEAQLNVIAARRAKAHPDEYPQRFRISVITVIDWVVGRFRGVLYTLFAAVGLLLVIACCNVANMLLARATVRERELTLRAALGASRTRLVRQLMAESLLLALAGAAAGCLIAYGGVKAVAYFLPQQNVPFEVELRLEAEALFFSLATAVVTAVLFGLLPAWHGARRDLVQGLKDAGKGTSSVSHGWVRNGLIVGEVALSLVLLLGAGLLMRSFIALVQVDLGFTPSNMVITSVRFPKGAYLAAPDRQRYYDDALDRIRALPGIESAATSSASFNGMPTTIERPGLSAAAPSEARFNLCSEEFLRVLGVTAMRGRGLSRDDVSGARRVAVVNETLVKQHFSGENPIGQLLRLPALEKLPEPVADPTFEIVGIIRDIRNRGLRETVPAVYLPSTVTGAIPRAVFVRTSGEPAALVNSIRQALAAVDRTVAVDDTITVDEVLRSMQAQPRFTMIILAAFAGTGLLLVAVGVYGVMAYAVSRRTQEIAIRMALGADRRLMLSSVLRSGALLLVVGVALGLVASLGTNRMLADDLLNISAYDPVTMASAVAVIMVMGLVACYLPALRAARVDPMTALRHE